MLTKQPFEWLTYASQEILLPLISSAKFTYENSTPDDPMRLTKAWMEDCNNEHTHGRFATILPLPPCTIDVGMNGQALTHEPSTPNKRLESTSH